MRKINFILFLLLITLEAMAQDIDSVRKEIEALYDHLGNHATYFNNLGGFHRMMGLQRTIWNGNDNKERFKDRHEQIVKSLDKLMPNVPLAYKYETHADNDTTIYFLMIRGTELSNISNNPAANTQAYKSLFPSAQEYVYYYANQAKGPNEFPMRIHDLIYMTPLDSTRTATEPFSAKDFCDFVSPIFNQKGVTVRKVHYSFDNSMSNFHDGIRYIGIEKRNQSDGYSGDTYGVHYIVKSYEQGMQIAQQLYEAIVEYSAKHPHQACRYQHTNSFYLHNMLEYINRPTMQFRVFVDCDRDRDKSIHFLFLNTDGSLVIPQDYEIIKDYDNGRITYYEDDRLPGQSYYCDTEKQDNN